VVVSSFNAKPCKKKLSELNSHLAD